MNLAQRKKLMKHFGSLPPEPPPPLMVVPKPGMEELMIWEQHTITLNKDPKLGFGFAISGGRDKPSPESGDTAIVVSDVLPNGPAMGRLFTKDNIVMVNGVSMENVYSNFTIQNLRSCGQTANVTVRRPRKIQLPASTRPTRAVSHSNLLDGDAPAHRPRRYSDGSEKGRGRPRARSNTPDRNGHSNTLPLMSTGYKLLPNHDVAEKPIRATLLKKKLNDEYGLKLGSQIFIKHMTDTGLAAKEGTLQEGDLILKINGMTTENLSLLETKHLVEKSRGRLTMTVLRDSRKFLVSIPEVVDSAPNSEDDRRHDSSSELEDISDLDMDMPSPKEEFPGIQREKELHEEHELKSCLQPSPETPPRTLHSDQACSPAPSSRRALSDSESDRSPSPPPPARRGDTIDMKDKYKSLSGLSVLPDPRSSPMAQKWGAPRTSSAASKPRKPVSESDSDRSASPPRLRQESPPRPNSRYKVLPDMPLPGMRGSPINVRQEPLRRVSSPLRAPPPDSESESDESTNYPARQGTHYGQDSRDKYRVLPELAPEPAPKVAPKLAPKPRSWSPPSASAFPTSPQKPASDSESEVSYSSVPQKRESSDSGGSNKLKGRYRVLPEQQSVPLRHTVSKASPPSRPTQDDSSGSDQLYHLRRSGSSEPGSHHGPRPSKSSTSKSGVSGRNKPVNSKPEEEPLYSLPPDSYPTPNVGYSSDLHTVSFIKDGNIGLRLVGGNDVGIFVGGVQPNSPAQEQGMREGDQIMQVNKVDFNHFTREEAANYLLHIKHGEPVEICTQNKMHLYKKILKSSLGDNFYVRTHFDHEAESTVGLAFTRGEVFRVVDTMHRGKLGNWLAIRMGNDLHELDKGTIPNQARAETLALMEQAQRASGDRQATGPRAEFWKLRGLRGAKKNVRRNRDDLLQLTIQGKFPAYEKVLLREANFKRPIVILGPLNDIAMEKLAKDMPDEYEVAEMVPRSGGGDSASTVIKLDTVRAIAEKDKHPLLDITPTAVERLNYIQYHPMVLFLDPHSRKDIKAMRMKYSPNSNKSSRRLYTQSLKIRKHCSHLFSARVDLQPSSNVWYEILKDKIRHQQAKPVWVSEVTLESGAEQDLDTLDQSHSDYLSAASDLEDTDGEPFTDGETYTDNEDLDEAFPGQDAAAAAAKIQRGRGTSSALARSSEPASGSLSDLEPVREVDTYSLREVPPLMHVPELRGPRHEEEEEEEDGGGGSPPRRRRESASPQDDDRSHRSFSDSDASAAGPAGPGTPAASEGPPDFVAPDPTGRSAMPPEDEGRESEPERETPPPASLSAIEEKLEQARMAEPQERKPSPAFIVLAHHQALQYRRTQIRGSDSSDEEEETDDVEWGPATEL